MCRLQVSRCDIGESDQIPPHKLASISNAAQRHIYQLPSKDFSAWLALRSILQVLDQSICSPRKRTNQTTQTKQQLTEINV
jgi:hypothetical protein